MAEPDRLRHQSENLLHRTGRPHMSMRNRADQPLADRTAAIEPRHLRGEAGFIEEHQAIRIDPGLDTPPGFTTLTKDLARIGIPSDPLLHLQRQHVHAAAHVRDTPAIQTFTLAGNAIMPAPALATTEPAPPAPLWPEPQADTRSSARSRPLPPGSTAEIYRLPAPRRTASVERKPEAAPHQVRCSGTVAATPSAANANPMPSRGGARLAMPGKALLNDPQLVRVIPRSAARSIRGGKNFNPGIASKVDHKVGQSPVPETHQAAFGERLRIDPNKADCFVWKN